MKGRKKKENWLTSPIYLEDLERLIDEQENPLERLNKIIKNSEEYFEIKNRNVLRLAQYKRWVTSIILCQDQKRLVSFLGFIFAQEDCEEDSVHGGFVLEDSHGPCPSPDFAEPAFYSVGGADALSAGFVRVAEAGEQLIQVVA